MAGSQVPFFGGCLELLCLPIEEHAVALASEFYLARAAECAREAEDTKLENVRDRSKRAEAAWLLMADQSAAREGERDAVAAEKAAKAETLQAEGADREDDEVS
jgi:hypothetical protein